MNQEREAKLGVAVGKKGVGKTYSTVEDLLKPYVFGNPQLNIPGRKVLILDINDEYMGVPAILPKHVKQFSAQTFVETRRIRPIKEDGSTMTTDEFAAVLFDCCQDFRIGLMLVEDPNQYLSDNMPNDIVGALCTQRHKGVDIIMHFQSIGRITPKVWQNMNWLRFHKNSDSVERHKNKFPDKFELFSIAELIVNDKFFNEDEKRFYCFVDIDELKIRQTSKFPISDQMKKDAITEYLNQYPIIINKMIKTVDRKTGKKHTYDSAYNHLMNKMLTMYF